MLVVEQVTGLLMFGVANFTLIIVLLEFQFRLVDIVVGLRILDWLWNLLLILIQSL
jgi:hypothetical protein